MRRIYHLYWGGGGGGGMSGHSSWRGSEVNKRANDEP